MVERAPCGPKIGITHISMQSNFKNLGNLRIQLEVSKEVWLYCEVSLWAGLKS